MRDEDFDFFGDVNSESDGAMEEWVDKLQAESSLDGSREVSKQSRNAGSKSKAHTDRIDSKGK